MRRGFVVFVPVVVALFACKKPGQNTSEAAARDTERTLDGGVTVRHNGITINQDGLKVVAGSATKLPDGWPADVPAYPGAEVVMAGVTPYGMTVTMGSSDPPSVVMQFYKARLTAYEKESEYDGGASVMTTYKSGDETIYVSAAARPGSKTTITISIGKLPKQKN